jgi:arginyl-tRNA synthetase
MLLFDDYWKKIFESIRAVYPEVNEGDIALDRSGHCDLTFRAFQVMKKRALSPDAVYSQVKEVLGNEDFMEKIESVGGYVNFTLKPSKLMEAIWKEMEGTSRYPDIFQDPERVSVEHTSTNPTGPIHIGRIRNSIIGDSLARLIDRYGYRVTTQYFINDSGKQVASLYAGYRKFVNSDNPTVYDLLEGYKKANEEMEAGTDMNSDVEQILRDYEKGEPETIEGIKKACTVVLDSINASLSRLGIHIDDYTWESDLIRAGDVDRIMEDLEEDLEEEEGARYIMSNGRKMFLTRKDGTSLYFLRDIAYHLYKFQNFDWLIDVLGENHKEHAGHIEYVTKDLLSQEHRLDFVFYSYVSLESGKMSTRKGQIVTLDELYERAVEESLNVVKVKRPELPEEKLNEIAQSVAVSAIRFHILKLNANKPMVFKWSEALNLEGDSAPFVMYSYARASSIMRKLEGQSHSIGADYNKEEGALIRQLYLYPFVLTESLKGLKPENIANYLLELTRKFNDFYTNCPVINAPQEERERRVLIINAYRTIIKDAANIVGMKILEEM